MAHIHITLVGGQPVPVYNGIIATSPDKVVFIYSESSKNQIEVIKSEINQNIIIEEQPPLSATDPNEIFDRAQYLAETHKEDTITLNISSGLKSWSHLFARVFDSLPNTTIIYIDQNNNVWNYSTMSLQGKVEFDIDISFKLQNNALTHYTSFTDFTQEDKDIMDKLIIARKYNFVRFNELTTVLSKKQQNILEHQPQGRFEKSFSDYVEWDKPNFVRLCLTNKNYGIKEFLLQSPHAISLAFNAGWFEYKIARMLSHWRHAKDIRLNCKFPLRNTNNVQFPKNEIDIIVNTGSKILFVECKTQITSSTDIDKFRTAVKNYGGMGSKALFITEALMRPVDVEKCIESNIIPFSLNDPTADPQREQALFKLLEQKLSIINEK